MTPETACIDGKCICRFDKTPITKKDNSIECIGERQKHKQMKVLVVDKTKSFSYQGKGNFTAVSSQSSNVFDSHRYGPDVYYYLRCSTPVQQVSTKILMQINDENTALIINGSECQSLSLLEYSTIQMRARYVVSSEESFHDYCFHVETPFNQAALC